MRDTTLTLLALFSRDDLFDCGAHYMTTMKGHVLVNRDVRDENPSENRKRRAILARTENALASRCQANQEGRTCLRHCDR